MAEENGIWQMRGIPASDPRCLHSAEELEALVEEIGFRGSSGVLCRGANGTGELVDRRSKDGSLGVA